MAWVEVQRVSDKKSNHLAPFEVLIDESVVGQLAPGESKAFEVAPGPHEIYSRVSWCRSEMVDIQLQVDQKLTLRCQTRAKNFLTDGYWATFGRARFLILRQVASEALRADSPSAHAGQPTLGRPRASASQQGVVPRNRERSVRLS
ncbi:MAG TPA: hypothetical protein VEL28_04960 [Candidatus Binatia bacterium]|nr:hypothetical protein [Candidatus Binatia bacterium]